MMTEKDCSCVPRVHCTCGAGQGVMALQEDYRGLQRRILLARRLIKHNLPGFVDDALIGKDLTNAKLYANTSLLEHLDKCDEGEQP